MSKSTILEVTNLVKHFKVGKNAYVHAVDNISFNLEKGQTFGLVGESGCGKSTCARTIIRIYNPDSGKIILDDQDISNLNSKQLQPIRRKIQMIFQDPYSSLNARMTVRDIINEPLKAHMPDLSKTDADQLIYPILELVGLNKEHARRYAHEFSGGQRQRICIARALILKPALVICDEAISALDVSIQAQIVNLLRDYQQAEGLSYLFIAHDLSMIRYVSDVIGVMYLGQLVEKCAAEEIYINPLHPYTKCLLSCVPIADPKQAQLRETVGIEGDIPSPVNPPSGCRFHTRCPQAMDICHQEVPVMKSVAPGHDLACHLY